MIVFTSFLLPYYVLPIDFNRRRGGVGDKYIGGNTVHTKWTDKSSSHTVFPFHINDLIEKELKGRCLSPHARVALLSVCTIKGVVGVSVRQTGRGEPRSSIFLIWVANTLGGGGTLINRLWSECEGLHIVEGINMSRMEGTTGKQHKGSCLKPIHTHGPQPWTICFQHQTFKLFYLRPKALNPIQMCQIYSQTCFNVSFNSMFLLCLNQTMSSMSPTSAQPSTVM